MPRKGRIACGYAHVARINEKANPPRGGGAKPTGLSLDREGGRAAERRISRTQPIVRFE